MSRSPQTIAWAQECLCRNVLPASMRMSKPWVDSGMLRVLSTEFHSGVSPGCLRAVCRGGLPGRVSRGGLPGAVSGGVSRGGLPGGLAGLQGVSGRSPGCLGPFGWDHLRPVLDNIRDTHLMGEQLPGIHGTLRLGRLIALQNPRGGVRGIVVGDVIRWLVGRSLAQQLSKAVEAATAPHQYALSTRAGTECVVHVLQVFTEMDPQTTIVSIDGVGAYDSISERLCSRH